MKRKQTRLNVTILILIGLIILVICLDVKFFKENTQSFVESHAYVTKDDEDITLDTGTVPDTEKKKKKTETEAAENTEKPEASESSESSEGSEGSEGAETEAGETTESSGSGSGSSGGSFGGVFSDILDD
jgi:hypothetical protein